MSQPKIFLGAPCYRESAKLLRSVITSFLEPHVHVLIVSNDASDECKSVLASMFHELGHIIHNEKNLYINAAWNQIAEAFLKSDADVLAIANADAVLSPGWGAALIDAAKVWGRFWHGRCVSQGDVLLEHPRHTAGVFFALAREHVKLCFPIPSELRMWWGDSWIWRQLERAEVRPHVIEEIRVWHAGSVSSSQVPEMREIVEADRIAWERLNRE